MSFVLNSTTCALHPTGLFEPQTSMPGLHIRHWNTGALLKQQPPPTRSLTLKTRAGLLASGTVAVIQRWQLTA